MALSPCSQLASGWAAGSWARFLCCSPSRAGWLLEGCKAPSCCPVSHRDAAKGAELNVNLCLTQAWPFFYPHTQQAASLEWARPCCPTSAALENVCSDSWCFALHPQIPLSSPAVSHPLGTGTDVSLCCVQAALSAHRAVLPAKGDFLIWEAALGLWLHLSSNPGSVGVHSHREGLQGDHPKARMQLLPIPEDPIWDKGCGAVWLSPTRCKFSPGVAKSSHRICPGRNLLSSLIGAAIWDMRTPGKEGPELCPLP